MDKQILFDNIDKIHTTAMGMDRIKKNLSLYEADVVEWCKSSIMSEKAEISRQGKNPPLATQFYGISSSWMECLFLLYLCSFPLKQ